MKTKTSLLCCALMAALSGCGGSSSDGSSADQGTGTQPTPQPTTLTLGISDAPVSGLTAVWVAFDSITLRSDTGEDTSFATPDANDQTKPTLVNLMAYTGDDIYTLLTDKEVAPGTYVWLRADVVNGDPLDLENTSHVVYEDGTLAPLVVKRNGNGSMGEIQLDGFTLQEANNEFVLEFDLKKSLVAPNNKNSDEIFLKPRGVRLENLATTQDIAGTVDDALAINCETDNVAFAGEGGLFGHAVYVYDASITEPQDLYEENEQAGANAPIATADVVLNEESGLREFTIAFLPAGEYLVAYTCTAHLDDPEVVDENVTLYQQQNATVQSAQDTTITFSVTP